MKITGTLKNTTAYKQAVRTTKSEKLFLTVKFSSTVLMSKENMFNVKIILFFFARKGF